MPQMDRGAPHRGRRSFLAAAIAALCAGCVVRPGTGGGWSDTVNTGANMRAGPGMDHRVITVVQAGTRVSVLGTEGNWHLVDAPGGRGWIHNSLIGARAAAPPRRGSGDDTARTTPASSAAAPPSEPVPPPCKQGCDRATNPGGVPGAPVP